MKSGSSCVTRSASAASSASSGIATGNPYSRAVSLTLENQRFSLGSSLTVTTRGTFTLADSSTLRQRTPTSWYAKTTARAALTLLLSRALSALGPQHFRVVELGMQAHALDRHHRQPSPLLAQRRVFLQHRGNRVSRTLPHLFVNAPHVFADDAKTDEQHADQEERDAEEREHTLDFGSDDQAPHRQYDDEEERHQRQRHSGHGEELQRHHREAGHEIEVETDQPVNGVLRLARGALGVRHLDLHRMTGEGIAQCRHERAHLHASIDRIDDAAV